MSHVNSIIRSLAQMTNLHEELITLAEEKKDAIIQNDVNQLSSIMTRETRISKRIQAEEVNLQESSMNFLQEKGIRSKLKLTVSEVMRLVFDVNERESLSYERNRLVETINRLKLLNERNQELIKQSLSFIDFSLNMYIGAEDYGFYQPDPKQVTVNKSNRLFDSRA